METLEFLNDHRLQLRNDGATLTGYAAVFYKPGAKGTEYRPFPEMVERIERGAFRSVIADGQDVLALVNHDMTQVLGRRSANTLRFDEDETGLRYSVDLPETTLARDTRSNVMHGNFGGSSIGFVAKTVERSVKDGVTIRTIKEVGMLRDVGPVTEPAFSGTSVSARCRNALWQAWFAENQEEWAKRKARMAEIAASLTR